MALYFYEGFDNELNSADLLQFVFPVGATITLGSSGTRWGTGKYLQLTASGSGGSCTIVLPATFSAGFLGIAAQLANTASTSSYSIGVYDSANSTVQMVVQFLNDGTGTIKVYRGTATSGTLIGTQVGAFSGSIQSWRHVALGVVISATVGTCTVQVEGTTVATFTGLNNKGSAGATFSHLYFTTNATLNTMNIDDLYFCDPTGAAPLNTFLGDVRVETPMPTADDVVQFTHLSGSTNFAMVNETAMDSDTTYNSSNTPGQQDTLAHAALTGSPTTIFAVQVVNAMRKDDVATHTAKAVMKSNVTTVFGATVGIASAYTYQKDIFTVDPDTGLPWTTSGVNACKTGYNLVS